MVDYGNSYLGIRGRVSFAYAGDMLCVFEVYWNMWGILMEKHYCDICEAEMTADECNNTITVNNLGLQFEYCKECNELVWLALRSKKPKVALL